jgi:predicted component of type VI protein secretion system
VDLILEVVSPQAAALRDASRHTFDEKGGTIGRETDNSWVLPHLAGRHAEVTYAKGVFFIRNSSQYDVLLNSRPLVPGETWRLKPGDRLFVGPYELGVSVVDSEGLPPLAQDDAGRGLLESCGINGDPREPSDRTPSLVDPPSAELPTAIDLSAILPDDDPLGEERSEPPSRAISGPREATSEPSEELDPLALLNLQEDQPPSRRPPPTAPDLDSGSPLDQHFRPRAAVPDTRMAPPLPRADPNAIPDDYDPLGASEPLVPPSQSAPLAPRPTPHADIATVLSDAQLPPPLVDLNPAQARREGDVEFSAYCPFTLPPSAWQSFVVYVHTPSARRQVHNDSEQFFGRGSPADVSRTRARASICEGAEIQVAPSLPDCEFNPPRASILLMEEWHRVLFRVRASVSRAPLRDGVVQFYVGPVLVGELAITTWVGDMRSADSDRPIGVHAEAYQAVFVSYCHQDAVIVDQLQRAYSVLGIDYLRDIAILRSGEEWNEAILAKIPTADIFQLCWSHTARASRFVEQEWRCALQFERRNFIRPVYWETPMPEAPSEMAHLHFAQLQWLQQGV